MNNQTPNLCDMKRQREQKRHPDKSQHLKRRHMPTSLSYNRIKNVRMCLSISNSELSSFWTEQVLWASVRCWISRDNCSPPWCYQCAEKSCMLQSCLNHQALKAVPSLSFKYLTPQRWTSVTWGNLPFCLQNMQNSSKEQLIKLQLQFFHRVGMRYWPIVFIAAYVLGPVVTHMTECHPTQENKQVEEGSLSYVSTT